MINSMGDMVIFASVVRSGSLTAAGRELDLPKATVSRRLSQLEERIKTRLLNRSTRKMSLTQEGDVFLQYCERLLNDTEAALNFSRQLSSRPHGVLRITMPSGFGSLLIPELIKSFISQNPDIILDIDESGTFRDLIKDKIDLAFRAGELEDSSLVARALPVLKAGFYASPDFVKKVGQLKALEDLQEIPFIRAGQSLKAQTVILNRDSQTRSLILTPSASVTTTSTQVALAVQGAGFVFAIHEACKPFVERKELLRIFPSWEGAFPTMHIVTPYRKLLPKKTELFINHIFRGLKKIAGSAV